MPNRFKVWGILFALVIPFSLVVTHFLKKPVLYPGDRLETRTCRQCGGSGVESGEGMEGMPEGVPGAPRPGGPCIGCAGKKQVSVVLPGPNHPSKIKGSVFEAKSRPQGDEVAMAQAEFMADRDPRQPVPGAIAEARIVFEKGSERVEVSSNQKGRFRARLAPGEWKYTATAAGFPDATGTLAIPVRSEPIYQEEAHIIGPDEVGALDYQGLPVNIPMTR